MKSNGYSGQFDCTVSNFKRLIRLVKWEAEITMCRVLVEKLIIPQLVKDSLFCGTQKYMNMFPNSSLDPILSHTNTVGTLINFILSFQATPPCLNSLCTLLLFHVHYTYLSKLPHFTSSLLSLWMVGPSRHSYIWF